MRLRLFQRREAFTASRSGALCPICAAPHRPSGSSKALSSLARERLRETLVRDYAKEHNMELDLDHLPEEVSRAVNEKINGLIERHRDEIEYYF